MKPDAAMIALRMMGHRPRTMAKQGTISAVSCDLCKCIWIEPYFLTSYLACPGTFDAMTRGGKLVKMRGLANCKVVDT